MYLLTTLARVDLVEIESELVGDDLGGHRLAGAGRAGEQRVDALAERQLAVEAPALVDHVAVPHLTADLLELGDRVGRQNQIVDVEARADLARERAEPMP